jgi:hypothetical protein
MVASKSVGNSPCDDATPYVGRDGSLDRCEPIARAPARTTWTSGIALNEASFRVLVFRGHSFVRP